MYILRLLSVITILATACASRPTSNVDFNKVVVKDPSAKLDKNSTSITLRVHLANQDMTKFHDLAMNIVTPGHAQYGNHLDHETILAVVAPKQESSDLVMQWLTSETVSSEAKITMKGDYVTIQANVKTIEKPLNAEYNVFVRPGSNENTLRTLEYSLPASLKSHVDMVQPTTFFGLRQLRSTISAHYEIQDEVNTEAVQAVTGCSGTRITPTCLANLYNFATAKVQTVGLLGIAGFLEEYAIKTDFTTFLNSYAFFANKAKTFTCTVVNSGSCPSSPSGIEANLDVYTAGCGQWLGSGSNTNEPYLEFLNYLLALPDASLPNTLSILYGDSSIGSTCTVAGKAQFTTAFPAACPWVTMVGGITSNLLEAAWSSGGGGFSEIFGRSSAQSVSGTSCSAPTTAGTIQLLNNGRIAAGKKGLGFLNLWLYSTASTGFTDIKSGKITGCGGQIAGAGFSAVTGWDPATGLGTPNYGSLLPFATSTA
ncbi:Pro-kumamolisin, activation domain-containing protein [Phaeosphaeriaceae sp. PMI808]|nr:Pro-kumamolisin, activation domain-containing protein [Phaeosphaeriaceae sp. PMI808]